MRLGADPDQLERLARFFDAAADRVRSAERVVGGTRAHLPVVQRAAYRLLAELEPALRRLADRLAARANDLRRRAARQRNLSTPIPGIVTIRDDPDGDGRWIGRAGPDDARTVVVMVPGVGSHLGHRRRLGREAARFSRHLRARYPDEDVTVLAWLGYDAPDTVLAGVDRRPAVTGATTLAADLRDLQSAGVERIVLVGHSYGALVATRAVAAGVLVDELVLLGAPGLGVDDPSQLRLAPGGHIWSAVEDDDRVAWVARTGVLHGPDPARSARPLPTAEHGHARYLSDSVLIEALGEVVTGRRR
ncbi:MAG: alpha/beta fold hydrolase [Actinomycetes bacterium]